MQTYLALIFFFGGFSTWTISPLFTVRQLLSSWFKDLPNKMVICEVLLF